MNWLEKLNTEEAKQRRLKLVWSKKYPKINLGSDSETGYILGWTIPDFDVTNKEIPNDCDLIEVFPDRKTYGYYILIAHKSFEPVPLGKDLPVIVPDYEITDATIKRVKKETLEHFKKIGWHGKKYFCPPPHNPVDSWPEMMKDRD